MNHVDRSDEFTARGMRLVTDRPSPPPARDDGPREFRFEADISVFATSPEDAERIVKDAVADMLDRNTLQVTIATGATEHRDRTVDDFLRETLEGR